MVGDKGRKHLTIIKHGFWGKLGWKKTIVFYAVALGILIIVAQFIMPTNRILPFTSLDGVDLSWQPRDYATDLMNNRYKNFEINIFVAGDNKPILTPKLSTMGVTVNNEDRVNSLNYPWYMRLVPTSALWYGLLQKPDRMTSFDKTFDNFVKDKVIPKCEKQPVNASVKVDAEGLSIADAENGRVCSVTETIKTLKMISPALNVSSDIYISAGNIKASVSSAEAKDIIDKLSPRLSGGIKMNVEGDIVTIPFGTVANWLDFLIDGESIDVSVNSDRARDWLDKNVAPKVNIAAGVSYISTRDFEVVSRVPGSYGRALNNDATVVSIQNVIDGTSVMAIAATVSVPPAEQYNRIYTASDAGLKALLENYAKDHSGTFGISVAELDGAKRHADYNGDKQFVTASTYKLMVAYSLLKSIDEGKRSWEANADCFNKMISLSDNPCSEAFLKSLGQKQVTTDVQAIGMKNSTFLKSDNIYSTPNDLVLLLGMIAKGQNFSEVNQQRLLTAMKANVYRQGVPAGVPGSIVADKVGFLWGLLHDAAIVYSPHGTYVITVMTDGSSWATIADIARQVDSLLAEPATGN